MSFRTGTVIVRPTNPRRTSGSARLNKPAVYRGPRDGLVLHTHRGGGAASPIRNTVSVTAPEFSERE